MVNGTTMNDSYAIKFCREGEGVIAVYRKHPLLLGRSLALPTLLLLADFFFLSWFVAHGRWGIVAFGVVLLIAVFFLARALVAWSWDVFIVTDRRIIDVDQRGFFHRTVSEAGYSAMQDVRFAVSGLWQTVFRYGSVHVQTAGAQATIEATAVRDPQAVHNLVIRLQKEQHDRSDASPLPGHAPGKLEASARSRELLATLQRIRDEMGHEQFDELVEQMLRPPDRPE